MKSRKYLSDEVVIILQDVYEIVHISKTNTYILIAVGLCKQKALDADPRTIQQIVLQGVVGGADRAKLTLYTILEKSKETMLEFYKGTAKFCEYYK